LRISPSVVPTPSWKIGPTAANPSPPSGSARASTKLTKLSGPNVVSAGSSSSITPPLEE
jgi:hypothetical protein